MLKEIVKEVVSQIKPFYLTPATVLFALENQPRMVWLKFRNSPEFANLKKQIEKSMIIKEHRNVIPHLTLARFDEKYFSRLKKFLPEKGIDISEETRPLLVDSINIMESHLTSQGAEYKLVLNLPLTGDSR